MSAPVDPGPAGPDPLLEIRWWRTGAVLVASAVVAGLIQAVAWALIAPTEPFKVDKTGSYATLPTGSSELFTDIALFALLGLIGGAVLVTIAWNRRTLRGPGMALLVAAATGLGALASYLVARVIAPGVDPDTIGASSAESIVGAPAIVGNAMVVLAEPALAALIYTILTLAHSSPDLGRGLATSPSRPVG